MSEDATNEAVDWSAIRVDRRTVDRLHARRLISAAARARALDLVDPPRNWGLWTARLLTVFGVALMLSGLVYFFAFNWDRIPPLAKLGGIGALLVAAAAATAYFGLDHAVGRIATTVAAVLIGVFLAVFGQIYQTGADAWGLFALWAALILPWTVLSTFAPTWAVWLVVANVAIRLWWPQTHPGFEEFYAGSSLSIIVFDGLFLVLREVVVARGATWAAGRWTRFLPLVPMLGAATLAQIGWIVDHWRVTGLGRAAAAAAAVAIVAAIFGYRVLRPDVAALALAVTAACVVVVMFVFDLLAGRGSGDPFAAFLLTGLFTIALFAAAVAWLRRAARDPEVHHD